MIRSTKYVMIDKVSFNKIHNNMINKMGNLSYLISASLVFSKDVLWNNSQVSLKTKENYSIYKKRKKYSPFKKKKIER